MMKYLAYKLSIPDSAYKYIPSDELIYINSMYVKHWQQSEIGKWCNENNIIPVAGTPCANIPTFSTIIPYYISLTTEQQYEYKQIIFFNKLMEIPFDDNF